ncbi:type I restriction endonuclease subunit R [Nonomuraea phyllanthi]|uniref:type I restriction endonuclease subunit R n=1 Tax=Nonomuraea phyllanthi TaxID=2219224 RepID=UPI00186B0166|nr:HsdR family type I site-specific deoxyribonuclease [Nonomuraea phyllanthi]
MPERDEVELPLVRQLLALGWTEHLDGSNGAAIPVDPAYSGRNSFSDHFLRRRFRDAVQKVNRGPGGGEWLDDSRLDRIEAAFTRLLSGGVLELNQAVTEILLKGVPVEGLPEWDGGKVKNAKLVDWDDPKANDLLVVNQFRVRTATGSVVFDLVLFVNGIPLVVVETKRPGREGGIGEAIADLRAYTGERESGFDEGAPEFFRFVQLLIATDGDRARLGTISSEPEHYSAWRTVEPARVPQVRAELGVPDGHVLSEMEVLAAGVLRPEHLLDIVRNFIVVHQNDDRKIKLVARYQQFRAVHRIVDRLRNRRSRLQGAAQDERGGILWHTQGSGKSLTIVFLIRKMRTLESLSRFKIVIVSDRRDLQRQLEPVLALSDETPLMARRIETAKAYLGETVPGVVQLMIQQAQRDDSVGQQEEPERFADDPADTIIHFPRLNTSDQILLLIDEAHRNQAGRLHARLSHALPNAAKMGLTGTPIIRRNRQNSRRIFGQEIDVYTLSESEIDGATVPIRYEGRETFPEVVDRVLLDEGYEAAVPDADHRTRVQRAMERREILEREHVIAAKARDMLLHWVDRILPGGFKAQVVAISRLATVRYREAFLRARAELVSALEHFEATGLLPEDFAVPDDFDAGFAERAARFLPLIRIIDFVPVISAGPKNKDPNAWSAWTSETAQRRHIDEFKDRLPALETFGAPPAWMEITPTRSPLDDHEPWSSRGRAPAPDSVASVGSIHDPWYRARPDDGFKHASPSRPQLPPPGPGHPNSGGSPIAFVIVVGMLLTGFDAPIEQALYLDRPIREAELLQAIARTNRTARLKEYGLVVDYVALSENLDKALSDYRRQDVEGALESLLGHDLPELRDRRQRIRDFFTELGMGPMAGEVARRQLVVRLADPLLRVRFDNLARDFFAYLDRVLPRPEALEFEDDAQWLIRTQYLLRHTYRETRDGALDPYLYGAHVRRLLDRHIRAWAVLQRIPPVNIDDPGFLHRVDDLNDDRLSAMHMKHALERHIRERRASDPVQMQRLSERLDELIEELRGSWEQLSLELRSLVAATLETERVQAARARELGLDPGTELPIHSVLEDRLAELSSSGGTRVVGNLIEVSRALADIIRVEVRPRHFPDTPQLHVRLRRLIRKHLVEAGVAPRVAATPIAEDVAELALARRGYYLE